MSGSQCSALRNCGSKPVLFFANINPLFLWANSASYDFVFQESWRKYYSKHSDDWSGSVNPFLFRPFFGWFWCSHPLQSKDLFLNASSYQNATPKGLVGKVCMKATPPNLQEWRNFNQSQPSLDLTTTNFWKKHKLRSKFHLTQHEFILFHFNL